MIKECAGQSTLTALSRDIDQFLEDQASRGIAILLAAIIREGCSHDDVARFLRRADRHLPMLAKALARALDKAGELEPLVTSKGDVFARRLADTEKASTLAPAS
jgi:hypothetical protein